MKRICVIFLLLLFLTGCGQTQLPADWEDHWTVVCPVLAVQPLDGFALDEANDALYLSGIYYATWTAGEARPHTNESGEEAEIFDAQIYVLAQEFRSEASAAAELEKWKSREAQTFEVGEETIIACGGQDFELLPLLGCSASNPYSSGLAAFTVRGEWAFCVELLCAEGFEGDTAAIMEAFLSGFHYT